MSANSNNICCICTEPVLSTPLLRLLYGCGNHHVFHDLCLASWTEKDDKCPMCRQYLGRTVLEKCLRLVKLGHYQRLMQFWGEHKHQANPRLATWIDRCLKRRYADLREYTTLPDLEKFPPCNGSKFGFEAWDFVASCPIQRDQLKWFVKLNHTCNWECRERCFLISYFPGEFWYIDPALFILDSDLEDDEED